MLEFKEVTFGYEEDNYKLFENLSFKIDSGEFISIIGASGCGKSTIFRLINGLEKLESGSINVDEKTGYMPQKDLLFPWRTIMDNIKLPLELKTNKKTNSSQLCQEILKDVGLYEYKDNYPRELSGGMRQRVSFARTLIAGAELLMLDEPFSALDSLTKMSMQEWLLNQWTANSKTILFVTHDIEEAIFLSKKIYVFTECPARSLKVYDIPLAYPRNRHMMKDQDILELKEELTQKLRREV